MYIVSACLLGADCKYDGGNNDNEAVKEFCEGHKIVTVCPETAGGLKAPRDPAEQVKDSSGGIRVLSRDGRDLTEYFVRGAEISLEKVMAFEREGETAELAVLKAKSPSCGCCMIYDGTFTGNLTEGDGMFTRLLKERGIKVITEKDVEETEEKELEK